MGRTFELCFRSASVLLPFCFRYAGNTYTYIYNFPKMYGKHLWKASVLLPFTFRFASVALVFFTISYGIALETFQNILKDFRSDL